MRRWLLGLVGGLGLSCLAGAQEISPSRPVLVVDVKGTISVATSMYVDAALERAEAEQATLVVLRLDTPGGLVSATRDLIQSMLASTVPVIVYVAPAGARAVSAGTYILYAAHIAVMAPGTHLGAATPIQLGGLLDSSRLSDPVRPDADGKRERLDSRTAEERKAINDAAAYLRSLAQMRGRNAEWAAKAVRQAATLTARDAVREGVADLIANTLDDLLAEVNRRPVMIAGVERELVTEGRPIVSVDRDLRMRFLAAVADPNIAIILLMVGFYGILIEFWSPGAIAPGVTGAISLLLSLTALSVLPVNFGGWRSCCWGLP